MRNIDHANALEKALKMLPKDTGGDCIVSVNGISIVIGHDVNVLSVEHIKEDLSNNTTATNSWNSICGKVE